MKLIHEEVDYIYSWREMWEMRSCLWRVIEDVRLSVEEIVSAEGWSVLKKRVEEGAFELTIDGVDGRKPEQQFGSGELSNN